MSTPRPPECKCGHTEDQHSIVRDRYCMMSGCVCECFEGVAAPLEPLTARQWLISGGGGHEDGEAGIRARTMPMESAIELMDRPDWLTIAAMMCLNIDMTKDGQDVLPSELAKYMADIHKQIESGKSPR